MLTLERRNGESLQIFPAENIDPKMTVASLFENGAIEIVLKDAQRGKAKIGISAPMELSVSRE